MPITALTVHLDRDEYSRYWPEHEQVRATVTATGAAPGDPVDWALWREDGYGLVMQGTVLAPATNPGVLPLVIDLRTARDADGINWVTQGDYTVRVSAEADMVLGQSAVFPVSLVCTDELRSYWLYGARLQANDVLMPVVPPTLVTGVSFLGFSEIHQKGPFVLAYSAAGPTLSWAGGPPVAIAPVGIQTLALFDLTGFQYAVVQVDPLLLPAADVAETVVVDKQLMTNALLRARMRAATAYIQSAMGVFLEPARIMTDVLWRDREFPYADYVGEPCGYQRPYQGNTWPDVPLPQKRVLAVYSLQGYLNQRLMTQIQPEWITVDSLSGYVQLVPSAGVISSFVTFQAIYLNYLFSADTVPEFWHYDIAAGLRDLAHPQFAVVREAVAKKGALDILLQAGAALKGGIAAESTSRDGVSQSFSYTQSAQYGMYAHLTIPYQEWLDAELPKLKQRLAGIRFGTI